MKNFLSYICFFLLGVIQLLGQSGEETELVGRWAGGPPYAFTVENNIVFTASGGILQTLDISDPSNPILLGQVATNGVINDISKAGNYIYLAEGESGLKIIYVSDPSNPFQVSELMFSGPVNKLICSEHTLYITEGKYYDGNQWQGGGLRIVNVEDPFNPKPISFYDSPGSSPDFITLIGQYVYIDSTFESTLIIDVTDIYNPMYAGSISNTQFGNSQLQDNYLYVSWWYYEQRGLKVFDVSDPVNPIQIAQNLFPSGIEDIVLTEDYAYITNGEYWDGNNWIEGIVRVIDISNPENLIEVGFYDSPGNVDKISISNNIIIVNENNTTGFSNSGEGSGLRFIDISYPPLPKPIGFYEISGLVLSLMVRDNYAFVVTYDGGINIIDIQDISNPVQIGNYTSPGSAKNIVLNANYAFLTDGWKGLRVVDISDLTNPVEVGSYETGDFFSKIYLSGDFAYVLYGAALHILDVSNPLDIYEVSYAGIGSTPVSILVRGNYAFVGDWFSSHWGGQGHIWIFNISDPFNPVQIGEYDEGYTIWENTFNPTDLALKDNYLYVADRIGYLDVLDVSDPTDPFIVSKTSTFAENIEIFENFVFISRSLTGINIFDISNPIDPVLVEFYNQYRHISNLTVVDGKIFAAAVEYGMLVLHNALITDVENETEIVPTEFSLHQNYPNPFNPSTKISYSIPSSGFVTMKIYDILGSEIALLVNKEQTAGFYNVEFSTKGGSTSGGNAFTLPSGIYIYTLQFGDRMTSKKMILLK